jgi:hypothetical protein
MMAKRPCVILVADNMMVGAIKGFFSNPHWHTKIGCQKFEFDSSLDLICDSLGNDQGIYTRAHELLRHYLASHEKAVVILDCEWNGEYRKQRDAITSHIAGNLNVNGWGQDRHRVIAIDPELENWLWQGDNPNVANALGYKGNGSLRQLLRDNGFWPEGAVKPPTPKKAALWLQRQTRHPLSSSVYERLCAKVGLAGCIDPAFSELRNALLVWFPVEMAA